MFFLRFVRFACLLLFLCAIAYGIGTILAGAWGRLALTVVAGWLIMTIGGLAHQALMRNLAAGYTLETDEPTA